MNAAADQGEKSPTHFDLVKNFIETNPVLQKDLHIAVPGTTRKILGTVSDLLSAKACCSSDCDLGRFVHCLSKYAAGSDPS